MLRSIGNFVALVLCLLIAVTSAFTQDYTQSQIFSNNTAACSADNYGLALSSTNAPAYCYHSFPDDSWTYTGGWRDDSTTAIITYYHDPTPAGDSGSNGSGNWNISKGRSRTPISFLRLSATCTRSCMKEVVSPRYRRPTSS